MSDTIQVIGVLLAIFVSFILSVWVMNDAKDRGKPGCLVALMVLSLNFPGLLIWLIFRPEKKSERNASNSNAPDSP